MSCEQEEKKPNVVLRTYDKIIVFIPVITFLGSIYFVFVGDMSMAIYLAIASIFWVVCP